MNKKLGRLIHQAQYRQHRALDARLAEIGTTLVQWETLRAIESNPGASAHALAVETLHSDSAFSLLATRLVAQNLVERGAGEGRRVDFRLTANGKRILSAGLAIVSAVYEASFAALSSTERATLLELLERVT